MNDQEFVNEKEMKKNGKKMKMKGHELDVTTKELNDSAESKEERVAIHDSESCLYLHALRNHWDELGAMRMKKYFNKKMNSLFM